MMYTIKPLRWECTRPAGHPDGEWWNCETVFSVLNVEGSPGYYSWRYCVDEFYDEGVGSGESIDDCKRLAEEWYHGRLMPALTPVDS